MSDEPVERTINRERAWSTWAGTTDEMKRVAEVVGKQLDRRRELLIQEFEEQNPAPEDPDAPTGLIQYFPSVNYTGFSEYEIQQITNACKLDISFTDLQGDTTSGSIDAVFAGLDRRTFNALRLANYGSGKDSLELIFKRDTARAGVTLNISSPNQHWATSALSDISGEVDKGAHWWRFIRTALGVVSLAVLTWLLSGVLVALLLTLTSFDKTDRLIGSVAIGGLIAGLVAILQTRKQILFPAVEIVGEGSTPRGTRVVQWIVGQVIITSVLAIAVNTIK